MTTHRYVGNKKSLIYTDHFSLQLMFENIPLKPRQKCATLKETVWNTNKPGGWDKYKDLTEADDDLNSLAEDDLSNSTEYNHKMDKIMDKVKFKCFGKVSFTNKVHVDKPLENLYEEKNLCTLKKARNEKLLDIDDKIATLLLQMQRIVYDEKWKP